MLLLAALTRHIPGQSATGDIIVRELPQLTAESAATTRSVVKSTTAADVLVKSDKVELFNNTIGGDEQKIHV